MSSGSCQHCGGTEVDIDSARGDAVCTNCGSVLEDSYIVSDVQFAEDSHGAARAVGQLVSAEGGSSSGLNIGYLCGAGRESRAITLQKAKRNISNLCSQLRLPNNCVDMAYFFYKMALAKKLTKGRKNSHVVAACVYMVCRKEETPHMLLDLSDVIEVNVYELGKTYTRLSTDLRIHSPVIDPSLFILRFAHQLNFEDKTHEVSMTASRIVQRMKKDWMHTGRRPSGLCGAALLVAARYHNFDRSVDDIIKVAKVCPATVRKRLMEFGDTPSSRLTPDEFMKIDLEEEQDPPAFKAARKKKLKELEEAKVNEATKEVSSYQKLIEKELEETRKKQQRKRKYAQFTPDSSADLENSLNSDNVLSEQFVLQDTLMSIGNAIKNDDFITSSQLPSLNDATKEVNSLDVPWQEIPLGYEPTAASVGLKDSIEDCLKGNSCQDEVCVNIELDLTGLDDAELDSYIMDDREAEKKKKIWNSINAEYLEELKEKEERQAKEAEENANKPELKKKRKRFKQTSTEANTAGEAIEKMLQKRKISTKLNYGVLKDLVSSGAAASNTAEENTANAVESNEKTLKRIGKTKYKREYCQSSFPNIIKKRLSAFIPNASLKDSSLPLDDENDIKQVCKSPVSGTTKPVDHQDIIIPEEHLELKITHEEEIEKEEEEEEEEDDDEQYYCDDINLSAAQLLGRHRGESEADYNEYQDDYYD